MRPTVLSGPSFQSVKCICESSSAHLGSGKLEEFFFSPAEIQALSLLVLESRPAASSTSVDGSCVAELCLETRALPGLSQVSGTVLGL